MKRYLWIVLAAGLGLTGCATYDDTRREAASGREDYLLLQEEVRRLSGRMEGMQLEVDRWRTELDALRQQAGQAGQAEARALQGRVDELENRLRAVDAARERDKQELVDSLSKKISQLVSTPSAGSAKKQSGARRTGPSTGYEHEVKPGESLSAIAAAYGVTVKVIMEDNGIKDANMLKVGQTLFIRD